MADSTTSKNPESEDGKTSPSKAAATAEATLKNGAAGKAAPPVPEFKAPPKPGKEEAPGIDSLFMYKPIFVQPPYYLKQKENVYEGYENFSFKENNYEVMQKDIKFLQIAAQHNMLNLTEQEFERVIDIFEKIVFIDQKQSRDHLVTRFFEMAPKDLQDKVSKASLELIYNKYWKDEREKRKRSFLRMFWEKADFDDQDPFSAFRKRVKDKMKLRKKAKYEIDSYKKMFEIRTNCIDVLHILNDTLKREQIKKR